MWQNVKVLFLRLPKNSVKRISTGSVDIFSLHNELDSDRTVFDDSHVRFDCAGYGLIVSGIRFCESHAGETNTVFITIFFEVLGFFSVLNESD